MTAQIEERNPLRELSPQQLRAHAAEALTRARARSAVLTDAVDDEDLVRQHSKLMSPLVWDLAHIGSQEELWLVRDVGGREAMRGDLDEVYDAFLHARADRPSLPMLGPAGARGYVSEVRAKSLEILEKTPLDGRRLTENAFAFGMITQHEQQHDETMLATHQLRQGDPVLHASAPPAARSGRLPAEVFVPAGTFMMGTSAEPWALDNERPAHEVFVAAYFLDTTPVTNAAYVDFLESGGYGDQRWWSGAGMGTPPGSSVP